MSRVRQTILYFIFMKDTEWTAGLTKELLTLRKENARLKKIETLYRSLIAERRVQGMLGGSTLTPLYSPNGDVIDPRDGRIEVKYSGNHDGVKYIRWSWHKILGRHNRKQFEKLLLIGNTWEGEKYFVFDYNDLPWKIMRETANNGYRISMRHSTKDFSAYMKYLHPHEWFPKKKSG